MAEVFHDQIQWLARNGIATHLIRNPASVDSVFAVAKVQDLPGITFAASFDDGSLALGCTGELPGVLTDMAEEIVVEEETTRAPEAPDLNDKIDALTEALTNQVPPSVPDYTEQFEALQQTIAAIEVPQPSTPPEPPTLDDIVSGIIQALPSVEVDTDAIALRVKEAISDTQSLAQIESQLAAMSDALAKLTPEAESNDALIARFDALETKLSEGSPATQLTRMEKLLAAVHSQSETDLAPMQTSLTEIAETVQAIANSPTPDASSDSGYSEIIQTELNELKALLTALAETPSETPQPVDLTAIETQLAQTAENISALAAREMPDQPSVDLSGVEAQIAQLAAEIAGLSTGTPSESPDISGIEAQISALATQIEGLPDLGVQDILTRIEAQFSQPSESRADSETLEDMNDKLATLLGVDAKLQTLAVQIAAMGKRGDVASKDGAKQILGPMQAHLDTGFATIQASLEAMTTPQDVPEDTRLDTILAQLKTMQDQPAELPSYDAAIADLKLDIMARLDDLATRPAADIDLSGLRENQARFATAQAEVIRRLETAITDVSATTLPEQTDALDLSPITTMIEQLSQVQRDAFDELQSRLSQIGDQPAPTLDLSEQRQNQAQFASAFATALQRLETAIDRMTEHAQPNSDSGQDLIEIKDQLNALADIHRSDTETLRSDLVKLSTPVESQPDVTAQNQTFARFNTALTSVLDRLDLAADRVTQAAELTKPGPTHSDTASTMLTDTIERMKTDLINSLQIHRDMAPATTPPAEPADEGTRLAQVLGTVIDRFEALADRLQNPKEEIVFRSGAAKRGDEHSKASCDIKSPFDGEDLISLQDLRIRFAEMLAQHIREANVPQPKPNGAAHN